MKVSCLAMVRNEADIVATFCRHAAALFDDITVIDHGSIDGTREFLEGLSGHDARFHIYDFLEAAYEQAALMNFAVRSLPALRDSDWIFLLDADEFLPFSDRDGFRAALEPLMKSSVLYMRWSNLVPDSYEWQRFDFSVPVWRRDDVAVHCKVAFRPNNLQIGDIWIAQGNHALLERPAGSPIGGTAVDFPLLHLPIRSAEQFTLKLAQGVASYSLRDATADRREGFHWAEICEAIRSEGLEPEMLNWLGAQYGKPIDNPPQRASHEQLKRLGYVQERLQIALDRSIPNGGVLKAPSEIMLGVCTQFASDATTRSRREAPALALSVDDMNQISSNAVLSDEPKFAALWPRESTPNESLLGLDEDHFLRKFLGPAFWPIACLPGSAFAGHIPFLFCMIAALRPRRYVELGAHRGASFFAACQAAQRTSTRTECIAVDLWAGDEHAGYYDDSVFKKFEFQFRTKFADVGRFIRESFDDAVLRFEEGAIDLLHIDGLHTYEAVKHDFETWKDRMTPDGVVIFHDINVHERDFGVWQLWQELSREYTTTAFQHSHGLGVLCLGDDSANPIVRLARALESDREQKVFLQWFFENAGELSTLRTRSKDEMNTLRRESAEEMNVRLRQVTEVSAENSELKLRLGQLERELADEKIRCASELDTFRRSTSWRLTAPLRWLVTKLRRMLVRH